MRFLRKLPIIGFVLRCIDEDRPNDLLILILNFVMLAVASVAIWGYPALIMIWLTLTAMTGMFVLYITRE